jgi:hypothetical protein
VVVAGSIAVVAGAVVVAAGAVVVAAGVVYPELEDRKYLTRAEAVSVG